MKILFVARHFSYFRNFDGVVRQLADRGHRVHLAAEREEALGGRDLVDRLAAASSLVTVGDVPPRADERWFAVATTVRRSLDYLRYASPLYDKAPRIRERAWERTPQVALVLAHRPWRRLAERMLESIERALPTDAAIDRWLDDQAPDLVLLSPLIELGAPQMDILNSARRRGVRTAVAVWSWDHLTSKARLRQCPDRVLVWNDVQRREAIALHGVPPERITVTGAQCFDQWFGRRPSRTRERFCSDVGLDPRQPIVVYVCSALFRGGPSETTFVCRWAERLRASSSPLVRGAGILVRPHPQRMFEWDGIRLPDGIAFRGGHPIDEAGRDEYFDALYHAKAIVGVNTSALIEGAIVDRPVMTLLLPEFRESQTGTLHFRYLLDGPQPVLHAAPDLDAHVMQLEAALAGSLPDHNAAFVRRFVRPHGIDRAATPLFVEALEALASIAPPAPIVSGIADRAWAHVAAGWYRAADRGPVQWLMREASHAIEERERTKRIEQKRVRVRQREEERRLRVRAKEDRYRAKRRRQRVAQLKTAVRRVLAAGSGSGGVQS